MFARLTSTLLCASLLVAHARASVTVYGIFGVQPQEELGQGPLAPPENQAYLAEFEAYNNVSLTSPAPTVASAPSFSLSVFNLASSVSGLSPPVRGDFLGFSIEMSVVQSVSAYRALPLSFPPLRSRARARGLGAS